MGFFDDPNEDFAQAAKRFGEGKKPTIFINKKFVGEDGTEIPMNKRVDFEDGSFIEEIQDENSGDIRSAALNIKPHTHKPPKVKNQDDEPMDFFNF